MAARKEGAGLTQQQPADYLVDKHELNADDIRELRRKIASWRRIYEERYRDVRHKIFAHKNASDIGETNELLAKTDVEELKALFAFLSALYVALWESFLQRSRAVARHP